MDKRITDAFGCLIEAFALGLFFVLLGIGIAIGEGRLP